MTRSSLVLLTTLALAPAPAAWADVISGIVPAANRVALVDGKATVKFMVNGQGTEGECGLWVEYGDQSPPDTHITGRKAGSTLPKAFEHTFTRPGQFTVTASGRRVKTAAGCEGQASTVVTVAEAGRERGRGSGPAACPAGWALREGSFDRRTGAFTCVPAYPQQRIDCGPGLRYFERDGMLGCRHRGQGKRD